VPRSQTNFGRRLDQSHCLKHSPSSVLLAPPSNKSSCPTRHNKRPLHSHRSTTIRRHRITTPECCLGGRTETVRRTAALLRESLAIQQLLSAEQGAMKQLLTFYSNLTLLRCH